MTMIPRNNNSVSKETGHGAERLATRNAAEDTPSFVPCRDPNVREGAAATVRTISIKIIVKDRLRASSIVMTTEVAQFEFPFNATRVLR